MAVKVWIDGDVLYVDNGTATSNPINLSSFFFEKDDTGETVTLRDSNDDYKLRVPFGDVQDSGGTPIGTYSDVIDFLESIVAAGNPSKAISGNTETPTTVENTTSGGAGSTTAGVKGFSILFEGSGGSLNGVSVDSGWSASKFASLGNSLASESYVVPNVADADFPNSPRVLIIYVN